MDARKVRREILRDAVGEIILACIAREIREGQHHDGKMRGVGPRCWCIRYDGRRSVRSKEIPRAARNDDERDDPCAEQREYWTLLWYGGLGRLRLGRPADRERIGAQLHPKRRRRHSLDRGELADPGGWCGIAKDGNSRQVGRYLFEQFERFSAEVNFERGKSGGVAAWAWLTWGA